MLRTIVASLFLAIAVLTTAAPAPASAQVTVNIDIGRGTQLSGRRSISCARGALILRDRGFRDIRRLDCRGRYYVYRATRRGRRFEIAISARNGEVVDFRRVGRRW